MLADPPHHPIRFEAKSFQSAMSHASQPSRRKKLVRFNFQDARVCRHNGHFTFAKPIWLHLKTESQGSTDIVFAIRLLAKSPNDVIPERVNDFETPAVCRSARVELKLRRIGPEKAPNSLLTTSDFVVM